MPREDTAVVWFRRDLRVRDHPALAEACRNHERVVPLFVFDPKLLEGRFRSARRTRWMIDCLEALDAELELRGARLVKRHGRPETEVRRVAADVDASAVYVSDDVTAFARARDERVEEALGRDDVELRRRPGNWIVDVAEPKTGQGKPYTVFTPFLRAWRQLERRPIEQAPRSIDMPTTVSVGRMPTLEALGLPKTMRESVGVDPDDLEDPLQAGEEGGRKQVEWWLDHVDEYERTRDDLGGRTSRVSAYLRFGAVSARWLEERVRERTTDESYRDELAWRDFYAAVQLHFPWTAGLEFQEKYRKLEWDTDRESADAWREARTGFPVVDAAMRQLHATGWMHNRARMIVGSFLTKDLHQDWRVGEAHFMEHLLDGDVGSNNGGWQWIASTGTDPKPYFQRLFNPMTQQRRFDEDGAYVRRWCPELAGVPDERLATPWEMSEEEQRDAGCVIGEDWPEPVVDHKEARQEAIARYRAAG